MKSTILLLIALLAGLQYKFWLADGGFSDAYKVQSQVDAKILDNQSKHERNLSLKAEVRDLQHGYDAIEERSRHDLGLIKPGETFFQIVDR